MKELTIGTMYKSARDGFVEYRGIDRYCGEMTMMFRMQNGRTRFIDPAEVENGYLVEPENPEVTALKAQLAAATAQRDELRAALSQIAAVGYSWGNSDAAYMSGIAEDAIAKAEGGAV